MSDAVVGLELSVEATKLLHFADGSTRNGSIERISVRGPRSPAPAFSNSYRECPSRFGRCR